MTIKVICHHIKLDIPRSILVVVIGPDMLDRFIPYFNMSLSRKEGMLTHAGTFGVTPNGVPFIYLQDEYNTITTAHECLHAAVYLWDSVGAQLSLPDNDEVLTYTMDYLHERIEDLYHGTTE